MTGGLPLMSDHHGISPDVDSLADALRRFPHESDRLSTPTSETAPRPLTPELREAMIQYLVNTQALEGIEVPYDEAAMVVDEVFQEPLIDLG
jgi:hypothetical protein